MGYSLQIMIARKTRPFLKKTYTISPDHKFAEMGQFLQITIARKTGPFLKKNYTIAHVHELQNWVTFCKLQSQEKLDHFSRKLIQFLLIANCRNGPVSANYDHKKNYTISYDHELQKSSLSANYNRKKNFIISEEKL